MPDERGNALTVRAGRAVITPTRPGPLAGYVARGDQPSNGTLDDLEANLVWLSEPSGTSVAWLALDIIAVTTALAGELRRVVERHLDGPVTVVVCASHTHSGPAGWVGTIHPGVPAAIDQTDRAELLARVDALARAVASAEPVRVRASFGLARAPGIAANRNEPGGQIDDSVGVLEFRAADGSIAGMLLDYACHPTVLDAGNLAWSADWVGAARAGIRATTDAGLPIVFLQGAAGDVSTRFTRTAQSHAEATRLGQQLAAGVARRGRPAVQAAIVRAHRAICRAPRRRFSSPDEADRRYATARAALAELPAGLEPSSTRIATTAAEGAMVQRELARTAMPDRLELPITAVRVGDVAMVHLPVEPFTTVGRRIADASPFRHTRIVGYTDGYYGYLADAAARSRQTYEAMSSWFDDAGEQAIIAAAIGVLRELFERGS